MEVTIGQFAQIVGTTVRTLRYYDKMELLSPKNYNKNGRKIYTRLEWELYQQIIILKHFGLTLIEIKEQMMNEKLKNRELLQVQKQLIEKKQAELNDILEVITRMDRLYNIEGVQEEELNEFIFIMLDLFRREKTQVQAWENHFAGDKQLMKEISLFHDPEFKEKMDKEVWRLLKAVKCALQFNDAASRKKVREILNKMDRLYPANKIFKSLADDEHFFAKYNHAFNNYLPEDIAGYIYQEMKSYYEDKEKQ